MSQKKKSRPSAGTWAWFKLYNAEWNTDDTAALDYGSLGFLFELHCRMIGTEVPISYDVILRISRSRGLNRRTVDKMLETLTDCGLIYLTEDGYWRDEAGRVVDELAEVSQKISKRNTNVSQKRWQINEQNQGNSIPEEDVEGDKEAVAPSGQPAIPNTTDTVEIMETASDRDPEGRSDASSAVSVLDNWCHISPGDDVAKMIEAADHNSIIIAHGGAGIKVSAYLLNYLPTDAVERMAQLHKDKKLTAGAVRANIAAARESYNGNQKTA